MRGKQLFKKAKKVTLFALAFAIFLNTGEGFTTVLAHERELIQTSASHGAMYNKELNEQDSNSETVKVGDPDKVERTPEVSKEVEEYDSSMEIIEKRTENTKTFQLSDGSRVTKQYFEPIHKKVNGEWVDIDDTLEQKQSLFRSSKKEFTNEDGILPVTFDENGIEIDEDMTILTGDMSSYAVKENAVLYNHVENDTDVQYTVRSNHLFQDVNLYKEKESFTYQIHTDKEIKEKDGNLLIDGKNYVVTAPIVQDQNGKLSTNTKVTLEKADDGYTVTYTPDQKFLTDEETAYPVKVSSGVIKDTTLKMDSSYIRSGSPEVTSEYDHLMVGYDKDGAVSALHDPTIIAKARTFLTFEMPKLDSDRKLVSASLVLDKFTDYGDFEVPSIDVYDTNKKLDVHTVNWSNQPQNVTKISTNSNLRGVGNKVFDITAAAKKIYAGNPTSIELRASDESNRYYMIAFYSESTGTRPCINVVDQAAYDFDPDMDIESFDEHFRYYTKGYNNFKGISIDGIAKPYSNVTFDLYEKSADKETKVKSISTKSDAYKVKPIFEKSPIEGVQKYSAKDTNYTTDYLTLDFFPKKDTLYNFHISVEKDGKTSKALTTDSFVFYEVKMGDNLQSIATHYGVSVQDILKYNNTSEKMVKTGDILFIDFPHENPYLSEDVYTPPKRITTYIAEYKYRGPKCAGKCSVVDPVSVSTGNFYHQSKDFTMSDYEDIAMQRTYNSLGEENSSIFGLGFNSNLEQYLSYDKEGNLLYFAGDGKIFQFKKAGNGFEDDENYKIKEEKDGFVVEDKDTGEKLHFNGFGILEVLETKTGNRSTIHYDESGKITDITFGKKKITFEYYPKRNLVKSITLPNGAKVQYEFNQNDQLTKFIDALGNSEQYAYDAKGKMSSIINKNGKKIAENTYDKDGKVLTQKDGNGNTIKFTYEKGNVKLSYSDGNKDVCI